MIGEMPIHEGMPVMKILSLQAENIKKLTVVEIKPDGNLVWITGKNGFVLEDGHLKGFPDE